VFWLSTPYPGIENTEDPSAMECTLIEEILKDPKKRKEIPDITTTTTEEAIQKLAKGKTPDHMGLTAEHLKKGGKTIANSKVVMETVLPLSLASFIPSVVTTAAFIGDVFAVNPRCIGFCTLVRVGSIWSLIILSNILPRTGVTVMPL
jgi:hypothetical protein